MKADVTQKELESNITQHLCLVNAFDERYFSNNDRVDSVDEDLLFNFLQAISKNEVMK